MKYLDEYRDRKTVGMLVDLIRGETRRKFSMMEVCGGQTHSIMKYGLSDLLTEQIDIIHGPGCPVCVTPRAVIDIAISLAKMPEVIFCSFGDMLRVPGSDGNLLQARQDGAQLRPVYSPMDALQVAIENPLMQVVFFAVGFETTAPANAMLIDIAAKRGIKNISMLSSHVLVPPALEFLLENPNHGIQAILAAGHVCTIAGYKGYHQLAQRYQIPIVVAGFEPVDILEGMLYCSRLLNEGKAEVVNQYRRSVSEEGNRLAQDVVDRVFELATVEWRGIGFIADSGLKLRSAFEFFDANIRFTEALKKETKAATETDSKTEKCQAGKVLQGLLRPIHCPLFGKECTPDTPQGAPMVSNEGACAAYFHHK